MKKEPRAGRRWWGNGGAMCFILSIVLAACAPSRPVSVSKPKPAVPYQIAAGDTLEIIVWDEDKVSGAVRVRPDGAISVALAGDVQAAGLTPEALASDIKAKLARFIDRPNVVVRVAATGSRRFFVIGNVRAPGAYELQPDQTFLQGLAVAGGLTEFADRDSIKILRKHSRALPVAPDYDAIIRGEIPDVLLAPNDTIVVP